MSKREPLVSYTLVTHDRKSELLDCLESIERQRYPYKEIILVDNGSEDGTETAVGERFPHVKVLRFSENRGAAAGRNRAIAEARGDVCVLLDDDSVLVDDDASQRAVEHFENDADLAAVCFQILSPSNSAPDRRSVPYAHKRVPATGAPCTYFCACGAALRRSAVLEAGGFWERLFWGGEELDLSYRLLERGHGLLYEPSIRVVHKRTPTARPPGRWIYSATRNRCWVAFRNLPWPQAVTTTLLWWGYAGITSISGGAFPHFLRGVRHAVRDLPGVMAERRCIGPETVRRLRRLSGRLWY